MPRLTETVGGDTIHESGLEIAKIGSTGRQFAHVEIEIPTMRVIALLPAERLKSACAAQR